MRIVHLIKHCHRGNGHVHVAVDLACAQAAAGHDVYFANAGGTYEALLRSSGVTIVRVPDEPGAKGAARSALAVTRLVARVRPDVVHAHMMTSAVLARAAVTGREIPVVTTMHNSFDGHSDLMNLGTVVVAVSEAERDLLLARGYRPEDVVTVLNGPVGSPREALDDSGGEEVLQGPSLMTLSGLHPRKGVPDVVDAFARLHLDLPDWHLHIVGDGPDRAEVEQQISRLGLDGFAHVRGSTLTPHGLLEQADIFVSASHAEPFGLSVAEARAAGCAVVATAVGGVPEVLDHGRAGILVPPGEPDALVDALRSVMVDPRSRREWQDRALRGSDYFSVARMSAEYVALYERLTRPRSAGSRAGHVLARAVPFVRVLGSAVRRTREQERPAPLPGTRTRTRITYFVPPSPVFAGVERVVHEIASGLATAHGDVLDVHVVYATRYEEPELVDPPYVRHDLGVDRIRATATSLRATLAAVPPDVLVCAQVEPSVVAWAATRGIGIEHFVTHLHGNPAIEESRGSLSTRLSFSIFRHIVSRRVSAV
ncbi:MAG: glycosyltransferase family 4 protein, partial [Janthinobacterium lividum]